MAEKKGRTKRAKRPQSPSKLKRWGRRVVILAAVLALGYGLARVMGELYERPGFAVPLLARGHTPACTPEYNSLPPTSGCHAPSQAPYGIHDAEIPHELQVHNLEHGAVIIQYRTSGLIDTGDLAERLQGLVSRLQGEDPGRYCRLIVAPYPLRFAAPNRDAREASQARIALTAWGHMQLLEEYDEGKIEAFADAFINRGPENVDDCRL